MERLAEVQSVKGTGNVTVVRSRGMYMIGGRVGVTRRQLVHPGPCLINSCSYS